MSKNNRYLFNQSSWGETPATGVTLNWPIIKANR